MSEDEALVTADNKPAAQSRPPETTEGAIAEHKAKQKAELAKTARRVSSLCVLILLGAVYFVLGYAYLMR